jgi:hypothetical protein
MLVNVNLIKRLIDRRIAYGNLLITADYKLGRLRKAVAKEN